MNNNAVDKIPGMGVAEEKQMLDTIENDIAASTIDHTKTRTRSMNTMTRERYQKNISPNRMCTIPRSYHQLNGVYKTQGQENQGRTPKWMIMNMHR